MAAITTRQTAGTGATVAGVPLTNAQLDQNFINLNDAKAETTSPTFTGTIGIATTPVLNSNEGEITSGRLLGRYSYRTTSGTPYYMDFTNTTTITSGDTTAAVRLPNLVTTNVIDSNIGVAYGTSYGNKKAGMFFVSGTAFDVGKVATGQVPLHSASINAVGIGYPTNGPRILFQDFAAEDDAPNVISYVGTAHKFVGSTTSKQALLPNTTIIPSQAGFNVDDSFISATSNYSFYGNMPIGVVGGTNASTISSISQNGTTITIVTTAAHNLVTGQIVTIAATANATTLISGVPATVLTVGTTDFTLIGSTSNLIGTTFIATGSGTGSGTVTVATQNSGKAVTIVDSVTFTYIHGTSTIPTLTSTHSVITPLTGTVTPSTRYNLYMAGTANNYIASNLGIGTTSPDSKLTVAGQIESTVTGFKFPDGTTQATAATGANWTKITTTTTATTKKQYVTDTTAGAFTVTLPATPAAGDYVYFMDAGNWATNNLTVARNGSTIEASATDLVFDVAGLMVQLIYDGTTWQVMSNIGPQGPIGPVGPAGANGLAGTPALNIVTATTQTAVAYNQYVLTNVALSTLTLPASPVAGDIVWVTVGNALTTNVMARNGSNIMGTAEDMTMNNANANYQMRYINATLGWRMM